MTKSSRDLHTALSSTREVTASVESPSSSSSSSSPSQPIRASPQSWKTAPAFAQSSPAIGRAGKSRRLTSLAHPRPPIDRRKAPRGKRVTMVNRAQAQKNGIDLVAALRKYYDVSEQTSECKFRRALIPSLSPNSLSLSDSLSSPTESTGITRSTQPKRFCSASL